jgi:H+-transporting ATPase
MFSDLKTFEGIVRVDQSALTGEFDAIEKPPGSEIFSGSIITFGETTAFVTKTGPRTFFGKTVQLVSTSAPKLHVEKIIDKITWTILLMVQFNILLSFKKNRLELIPTKFISLSMVLKSSQVFVMVAVAFVVSGLIGIDLLSILPLTLVLLSSGVPVALSAMFSVTMALGSQTLARKGALVTRYIFFF